MEPYPCHRLLPTVLICPITFQELKQRYEVGEFMVKDFQALIVEL